MFIAAEHSSEYGSGGSDAKYHRYDEWVEQDDERTIALLQHALRRCRRFPVVDGPTDRMPSLEAEAGIYPSWEAPEMRMT